MGNVAQMTEAPKAAADYRADRTSSPAVLAVVLVCLIAAVGAFVFLPGEYGRKAVSWTIAGFAVIGVFALLTYAFGALQFAARSGRFDLAKAIADGNLDGFIVTDRNSRVLYANPAYRNLSGAGKDAADSSVSSGCSPGRRKYRRRSTGSRRRRARASAAVEELRLSPPLAGPGDAAWYRIRVRPLDGEAHGTRRSGPCPT